VLKSFPLPKKYLKKILKNYYEWIEWKGEEGILEELMEEYFEMINSNSGSGFYHCESLA
jgi:hypothetical protein